jgi:hypothetical protein
VAVGVESGIFMLRRRPILFLHACCSQLETHGQGRDNSFILLPLHLESRIQSTARHGAILVSLGKTIPSFRGELPPRDENGGLDWIGLRPEHQRFPDRDPANPSLARKSNCQARRPSRFDAAGRLERRPSRPGLDIRSRGDSCLTDIDMEK